MTRKPDEKPCTHPPQLPGEKNEEQSLQEFCSAIHYEEISFENWCLKHRKLDLEIPVFVTREQLAATFRTVVRFTRTIRCQSAEGPQQTREKMERELVLGPEVDVCQAIKWPGLGDVIDGQAGDLWIIIRLKG